VTTGRNAGRALLAVAIGAVAARLSVAGCDDTGSYIYSGEQYYPPQQCLLPVSSIDIIAGNEPGSCGPVCILSLPQDGGQIAYVSTMCGPYPMYPYETDAAADPLCVAALNAFTRDALCEDGGVVLPPGSGEDAGVDAAGEAGGDAAGEAGGDAAVAAQDGGMPSDSSSGDAAQD